MRFDAGQHVSVRAGGRDPVPATIERDDGEVVTAVLALRDRGAVRAGEAIVEGSSPRGLLRVEGSVVVDPEHPEVLLVSRDLGEDVIQRRDQVRVLAAVPVTVTPVEPGGAVLHTSSLNLSGGGMLLRDEGRLAEDALVELLLAPDDDPRPIRVTARVVRRPASDEVGVRFEDVARADEQRISRLVMEHQRRELRLSRSAR